MSQRFPPESLQVLLQIRMTYFPEQFYDEMVRNQFNLIVSKQTNGINLDTFRQFIHNKTDGVSDHQIEGMFRIFDANGSGLINFEEFKAVFNYIRHLDFNQVKQMAFNQQQQTNMNISFDLPSNIAPQNIQIVPPPGLNINSVQFNQNSSNSNRYPQIDSQQQYPQPQHPLYFPQQNQPNMQQQYQPNNFSQQNQPPQMSQEQFRQPMFPPSPQQVQQQPQQYQQNNNNNKSDQTPSSNEKLNRYPTLETNLKQNNQQQQQQQQQPAQNKQIPHQQQRNPSESQRIADALMNPESAGRDPQPQKQYPNLDKMRQPNKQDLDKLKKQQEDPLSTLLMKFADLKLRHVKGEIDLLKIKKTFPSGRLSFPDLLQYLKTIGMTLTREEEQTLIAQSLLSPDQQYITTKDFLSLLEIKDTEKQQKKVKIFEEQKPIQLPQQLQQQQNRRQHQEIDILKSSIQSQYYFEVEEESLLGYTQFCRLFEQINNANNGQFTDNEFPATHDSIVSDMNSSMYANRSKYEWLRPDAFSGGEKLQMFGKIQSIQSSRIGLGKLISPYDIKQGTLGDCYFLSAMSSLAQEPQRILDLFITRIMNPYGIYCVKICHDGEWKAVYIDDRIPCVNRKPSFTQSTTNEIWVCVLEKVWAKLFKGYYNIESGYCREALRDLTGAPTKTINTKEEVEGNNHNKVEVENAEVPIILQQALSQENKFVVTAGADDDGVITKSIANRLGLISSHAYSIIGIKEITHPRLGKVTLLKMRNPWGRKEWSGDWSDTSELWTEELRQKLRVSNRDDGIFYMAMRDFQHFFNDIAICYYHDDFSYHSLKLQAKESNNRSIASNYSKLRVTEAGKYYISIIQKNKRTFLNTDYAYSVARLLIISDKDQTCVGMLQKKDREMFIECNLQPGRYTIQSKVFFESSKYTKSYVISSYGVAPVEITQSDKRSLPQNFLEQAFLHHARNNREATTFNKAKDYKKCMYLSLKEGFGYYYINNGSKTTMDIDVNFASSNGIKLVKPHRLPQTKLIIAPGREVLIPITLSAKGYSYKCSESYVLK